MLNDSLFISPQQYSDTRTPTCCCHMVSVKLIVFHHRYVGKDHAGQDNTKCKQYEARDAFVFSSNAKETGVDGVW